MFFLFQITNDPTAVAVLPPQLAMMGVGRILIPFVYIWGKVVNYAN